MPLSMPSLNGKSLQRFRHIPAARSHSHLLYCERNLIERFFNKLKHFRAIATRYDKLARNFLAAIQLASAIILLN
jgi:transposase